MSKKQAKSEDELPDWADEVTPSDDVMRKFYAPTGSFKTGPILVPERESSANISKELEKRETQPPHIAAPSTKPEHTKLNPPPPSATLTAVQSQPERRPDKKKLKEKANAAFMEFAHQWQRYLYPGQLAIMRLLFELAIASPDLECFTQYSEISFETKMSRRNSIYVVNSLVERGFLERLVVAEDAKNKGVRLRIHPNPAR